MEDSHNLTFAESNGDGGPPRRPTTFSFDRNGSVDRNFSFPTQQVGSLVSEQEEESDASAASLQRGPSKPAPLTNEDEDLLCDRDDDPPIVDDEPPANPTAVFHSNAARRVHQRRVPNAPSLCYSARKSTVSFSESVSVHYDNPAHDDDDCDDVDERATMTMHFDLEDDDELHHSTQGNDPPPIVTVAQPSPPRPPVNITTCNGGAVVYHSPLGDAVASPTGPFATSNTTFSVRSQQHQRSTGPRESDDASSVSAMLQQPTIFSDVSSVASSRGTIVTVRLGTDSTSHRDQRARPRL
jgi:hypothetical protein